VTGDLLAPADTKKGRLQRLVLDLHEEHVAAGTIPTNGRFLFYELAQRGAIDKAKARGHPGVKRGVDQDLNVALTDLRKLGLIPWDDIIDESRSIASYVGSPTVLEGLLFRLDYERLDPWGWGAAADRDRVPVAVGRAAPTGR
jgi:hypothetical protein